MKRSTILPGKYYLPIKLMDSDMNLYIKLTIRKTTASLLLSQLLLLFFCYSAAASTNNGNDNNYKYSREYLLSQKVEFIINNGDLAIREFRVLGLKKTRLSYILNQTDTKPGDNVSAFDPHEFVNRLKRKNIFSDIEVLYINESGMAVIQIIVSEKFTIIPIPMFSSNSRNTAYGLYILESNLMGYGKNLFTGATWSESGWSGILGYTDHSLLNSDFRLNLFLIHKNFIYQNGDPEGYLLSKYKSRENVARLDLGYGFSSRYFFYISGSHQMLTVDDNYSKSYNIPESREDFRAAFLFNINSLKYYEYFYYGFRFNYEASEFIPLIKDSKRYYSTEINMDYSIKVLSFHRITLYTAGYYGTAHGIARKRIGGKTGFRTLPADIITSDKFATGTISYEFPFLKYNWGAVTLLTFWEHGIFSNEDKSYIFNGPGAGILFYLKRVAVPPIGFNYARNMETGNSEFSVSAGFTF